MAAEKNGKSTRFDIDTLQELVGNEVFARGKEIPRFSAFRRAGIEVWHECEDLDLAVWISSQHGSGRSVAPAMWRCAKLARLERGQARRAITPRSF